MELYLYKFLMSFPVMRLLTGMLLTMATMGKPNPYLTIYLNSYDVIMKIY